MSNPIGWTDDTWNPPTTRGCDKVSGACRNCWAMGMAHRLVAMGNYPSGITRKTSHGVEWTGLVVPGTPEQVRTHAEKHLPKRARKRVFVQSMSDLFHEAARFDTIDAVFEEMRYRPHLTFQLLTKRPRQALEWWRHAEGGAGWPRNVWMGCTVENQECADQRIPILLELPAPVRWLSMEPLLGPVTLREEWLYGAFDHCPLGWLILGGESGHRARPSHPDWFRDIRDQCTEAGVPLYFKQWGEWTPRTRGEGTFDTLARHNRDRLVDHNGNVHCSWEAAGEDAVPMSRLGRKQDPKTLDGVVHREFPDVQ